MHGCDSHVTYDRKAKLGHGTVVSNDLLRANTLDCDIWLGVSDLAHQMYRYFKAVELMTLTQAQRTVAWPSRKGWRGIMFVSWLPGPGSASREKV